MKKSKNILKVFGVLTLGSSFMFINAQPETQETDKKKSDVKKVFSKEEKNKLNSFEKLLTDKELWADLRGNHIFISGRKFVIASGEGDANLLAAGNVHFEINHETGRAGIRLHVTKGLASKIEGHPEHLHLEFVDKPGDNPNGVLVILFTRNPELLEDIQLGEEERAELAIVNAQNYNDIPNLDKSVQILRNQLSKI